MTSDSYNAFIKNHLRLNGGFSFLKSADNFWKFCNPSDKGYLSQHITKKRFYIIMRGLIRV